jgi:hypothetical protein
MFGLIVFAVLGLYLWLLIWATRFGYHYAEKKRMDRQETLARWRHRIYDCLAAAVLGLAADVDRA